MVPNGDVSPVFAIRDLRRAFGDHMVLDGLSFDLFDGECLVVLGRSGSGKSVLLRQLNGLDKPDSGSVRFHGEETTGLAERELAPLRRRVAMLFQSGALFDSLTVFDNVAFPLREHSDVDEGTVRERVLEALARVGLHDVEDLLPASLSGGMKKRVALARSLVTVPEVMLYDEPTTGLDPRTAATIGQLIRTVQREIEVSSVVVTHDISLARRVGDKVAFLDGGRFRFHGTWDEANEAEDPAFADFLAGRAEDFHAA